MKKHLLPYIGIITTMAMLIPTSFAYGATSTNQDTTSLSSYSVLHSYKTGKTTNISVPSATSYATQSGKVGTKANTISPQLISGTDNRVEITDTTNTRYSPTVYIRGVYTKADGTKRTSECSGALVGPDVVLTAAHCLVEQPQSTGYNTYSWVDDVEVFPGYNWNNTTHNPFGTYKPSYSWVYTTGDTNTNTSYDYALLKFNTKIADTSGAGYYGYGVYPEYTFGSTTIRTLGYPEDKRVITDNSESATMWESTGLAIDDWSRQFYPTIRAENDSEPGDSGGNV